MTDSEYALIGRQVERLYGIDLGCYKSTQMRRRLDAYLLRVKAATWQEFFRRLDADAAERQRFKDYLTINVTSFFRDPDKFETLSREIIPRLVATGRPLSIWSAGCSEGAESYTLAMLMATAAGAPRFKIWATDIDPNALAKAKAGGPYGQDFIETVPRSLLGRYFDAGQAGQTGYTVKPELGRYITFQEHNLLRDPVRDRFDLIVCRNVIIYFTEEAKQAVFQRFAAALRPDGILFIGATETIPIGQARELGLEPVRVSFYRRLQESKIAVGVR